MDNPHMRCYSAADRSDDLNSMVYNDGEESRVVHEGAFFIVHRGPRFAWYNRQSERYSVIIKDADTGVWQQTDGLTFAAASWLMGVT